MDKIVSVLFFVLVMAGAASVFNYYRTLPLVEFGYPSGKCLAVYDIQGLYSCENLPGEYEAVLVADKKWVEEK